ncbi:unnamed protein product [Penicillium glandicola]
MADRDDWGRKFSSQTPNSTTTIPSANARQYDEAMKAQNDPKFAHFKQEPPTNPVDKTGFEVLTNGITKRTYEALKDRWLFTTKTSADE